MLEKSRFYHIFFPKFSHNLYRISSLYEIRFWGDQCHYLDKKLPSHEISCDQYFSENFFRYIHVFFCFNRLVFLWLNLSPLHRLTLVTFLPVTFWVAFDLGRIDAVFLDGSKLL